jgi:hypothetical protein
MNDQEGVAATAGSCALVELQVVPAQIEENDGRCQAVGIARQQPIGTHKERQRRSQIRLDVETQSDRQETELMVDDCEEENEGEMKLGGY